MRPISDEELANALKETYLDTNEALGATFLKVARKARGLLATEEAKPALQPVVEVGSMWRNHLSYKVHTINRIEGLAGFDTNSHRVMTLASDGRPLFQEWELFKAAHAPVLQPVVKVGSVWRVNGGKNRTVESVDKFQASFGPCQGGMCLLDGRPMYPGWSMVKEAPKTRVRFWPGQIWQSRAADFKGKEGRMYLLDTTGTLTGSFYSSGGQPEVLALQNVLANGVLVYDPRDVEEEEA